MTEPPCDLPRKIWSGHPDSKFPDSFFAIVGFGRGYGIGWTYIDEKPRRKWSRRAKARNRRNRLKKRLQKKYPLFWKDFYYKELSERSNYFKAIDPPYVPPQQR